MKNDTKQPTQVISEEQRDTSPEPFDNGVTRREFLQTSALVAGMGMSFGGMLLGCRHDSDDNDGGPSETRTYLFDFSQMDTSNHDMVMVAGSRHVTLEPITQETLSIQRNAHPILQLVPDDRITHSVSLEMPSDAIQLCYCQRHSHSATDGSWDMAMIFYHIPESGLQGARARQQERLQSGESPPLPIKWGRYGLTSEELAALNDPVGEDMLKDSTTTATSMVAGHPEIACGEPTSAAYIHNCIIGTQSQTQQLGELIDALGPAQPPDNWQGCGSTVTANASGWGTLHPVCNPDTKQQAVNSKTGALQYVPVWASATNGAARDAITPALTSVKDDTSLGVNVTTPPANTSGIIWTRQDGTTTIDQSTDLNTLSSTAIGYTTRDASPGHGYSVKIKGVTQDTGNSNINALVTVRIKNTFVRYLGIFVRFYDENGNVINASTVMSELGSTAVTEYFPLDDCCSFGSDDKDIVLGILGSEFEVLGMPVSSSSGTYTIPVPISASSIDILAGGLGNQTKKNNPYYETTTAGEILTVVFNLAVPSLFLALNAAAGLAPLSKTLEDNKLLLTLTPLVVELFATVIEEAALNKPSVFLSMGVDIGETLISEGAEPLMKVVVSALAEGETEEDLLDAVPLIGGFLSAVASIGTVAQLAETAAEVAQSPSTYVTRITLTHDIQVTIHPDINDTKFPSDATYFTVLAQFDGKGTPTTITQTLPPAPVPIPQVATFKGVPLGGNVTVTVGFYADNDWLAGQGSVGPVANTDSLAVDITITENKVPLDSTTIYTHKNVIELDSSGNHVWLDTTTPPAVTAPSGCNPLDGQLCRLTGININTTAGGIGYTFQSYNTSVTNCVDGALEQLYQFANIAVTTPQSNYLFSGCGFNGETRIAYDLLGKPDYNFYIDPSTSGDDFNSIIRQIRLVSGSAGFDGPTSNKAWGKLQFPSDAFLLHPAGQLISINRSINKIEVITLPDAAVTDDAAPLSNAYGGGGLRPGLMGGPTLAALAPDGTILVLESTNKRIQAFDLNGNPVPRFRKAYFFPLKKQKVSEYLSFSVEYTGYMYVLWKTGEPGSETFTMDIYTPQGDWLTSTTGLVAARLAVSYWRDIYAENFQVLKLPDDSLPARTEPSISHWTPSTP